MALLKETLVPIDVLFLVADPGPGGIQAAWDRLEHGLPSLKGRKFYGAFSYPDGPYRACVAVRSDDDEAKLGLTRWTIPGGVYLRRRLVDWQEDPDRIRRTFGEMAKQVRPDDRRPTVEYYRRHDEVLLYLPIAS